MITKRNCVAIISAIVLCTSLVWLCTSIQGSEKFYEVHPYITTPEYRTDTARAIDAYERMMERYMDLTERNLVDLKTNLRDISRRLVSIDTKLTRLTSKMTKIEKALGIEQTKELMGKKSCPKQVKKKIDRKSSLDM